MSESSRGAALLMEMGTGKSLTAIAITGALAQAGRIRRVLVVAPLSILGVWEEEFQKFAAFPYALAALSGSGAKKLDTLRHMTGTVLQVVVVNYESAWRMEKDLAAWLKGPPRDLSRGERRSSGADKLSPLGGSEESVVCDDALIIADEGHKIKTHNIAASKATAGGAGQLQASAHRHGDNQQGH